MGISGLLPFLKKASRPAHLQEFKGQTAAVDVYGWLHKGAFSCADKLVRGEYTDGYVLYVMKQINLLLSYGIKPIMVFDGCHLPSKAVTETKRRENRERSRKKAKELLREGKTREAREHFQRCVEVTSDMAFEVISACRARGIDIVVAPYEADAQLAYLNLSGIAQVVITEDSDLIVFGSKATLFKMDNNGGCVFVDHEKLHLALNVPRDKFSFEKFRNMSILSGCDYLPSLPGIGLGKACKFFTVTANTDIYNVLCKVPSYLNMPQLEVTREYREGFMQAINTFLYQLVFDPLSRTLRPLKDYPDGMGHEDIPYAGKFVGHERALQIALGNVNVQTGEVVDDFDPETYKPLAIKTSCWDRQKNAVCTHPSIWTKDHSHSKMKPEAPSILSSSKPTTKGKEVKVITPLFRKKRKSESKEDITEEELQNLYSHPEKRNKVEASPFPNENHTFEGSSSTLFADHATKGSPEGIEGDAAITVTSSNEKESDDALMLTSPHKSTRAKNPFAKSHTTPKKATLSDNQFSAIRKFSRIKRTVVDQKTIVQSRYFSSPVQVSSSNDTKQMSPSKPDEAEDKDIVECLKERECSNTVLEEETQSSEDSSRDKSSSPTCQVQNSTEFVKRCAFQWTKFSHSETTNIKIKRSEATTHTFKAVTPNGRLEPFAENLSDISLDKSLGNAVSQDGSLEEANLSQVSLVSDVGSVDNESFGLTPSSLPSSPSVESCKTSPLKDTTNCPTESSCTMKERSQDKGSLIKNKCRTSGLSRPSNKKKEVGKKQLSLTDMFGFRR